METQRAPRAAPFFVFVSPARSARGSLSRDALGINRRVMIPAAARRHPRSASLFIVADRSIVGARALRISPACGELVDRGRSTLHIARHRHLLERVFDSSRAFEMKIMRLPPGCSGCLRKLQAMTTISAHPHLLLSLALLLQRTLVAALRSQLETSRPAWRTLMLRESLHSRETNDQI